MSKKFWIWGIPTCCVGFVYPGLPIIKAFWSTGILLNGQDKISLKLKL